MLFSHVFDRNMETHMLVIACIHFSSKNVYRINIYIYIYIKYIHYIYMSQRMQQHDVLAKVFRLVPVVVSFNPFGSPSPAVRRLPCPWRTPRGSRFPRRTVHPVDGKVGNQNEAIWNIYYTCIYQKWWCYLSCIFWFGETRWNHSDIVTLWCCWSKCLFMFLYYIVFFFFLKKKNKYIFLWLSFLWIQRGSW